MLFVNFIPPFSCWPRQRRNLLSEVKEKIKKKKEKNTWFNIEENSERKLLAGLCSRVNLNLKIFKGHPLYPAQTIFHSITCTQKWNLIQWSTYCSLTLQELSNPVKINNWPKRRLNQALEIRVESREKLINRITVLTRVYSVWRNTPQ